MIMYDVLSLQSKIHEGCYGAEVHLPPGPLHWKHPAVIMMTLTSDFLPAQTS